MHSYFNPTKSKIVCLAEQNDTIQEKAQGQSSSFLFTQHSPVMEGSKRSGKTQMLMFLEDAEEEKENTVI